MTTNGNWTVINSEEALKVTTGSGIGHFGGDASGATANFNCQDSSYDAKTAFTGIVVCPDCGSHVRFRATRNQRKGFAGTTEYVKHPECEMLFTIQLNSGFRKGSFFAWVEVSGDYKQQGRFDPRRVLSWRIDTVKTE